MMAIDELIRIDHLDTVSKFTATGESSHPSNSTNEERYDLVSTQDRRFRRRQTRHEFAGRHLREAEIHLILQRIGPVVDPAV